MSTPILSQSPAWEQQDATFDVADVASSTTSHVTPVGRAAPEPPSWNLNFCFPPVCSFVLFRFRFAPERLYFCALSCHRPASCLVCSIQQRSLGYSLKHTFCRCRRYQPTAPAGSFPSDSDRREWLQSILSRRIVLGLPFTEFQSESVSSFVSCASVQQISVEPEILSDLPEKR